MRRTREPKISDFPEHSFIHAYMRYMDGSETARAYDFWCACWLISYVCGRHVLVNRPRAPVYMNMYLILAADSAVTRKSFAVSTAMKFARQLNHDQYEFVESKMSAEKLRTILSDRTRRFGEAWACLSVSEMINFFGKSSSVGGLVGLLTDLYDCPNERIGGGTMTSKADTHLKNVFPMLITASTPTWLMQEMTPSVIEGGFTSRALFVWSEEAKKAISWPTDFEESRYWQLLTHLMSIGNEARRLQEITINEKAKRHFTNWYKGRHIFRDSFRASFGGREDSHILRLAAILCIADGTYQIQLSHIRSSIAYITQLRDQAVKLFEGLGSRTALVIAIDRIRDTLVASGKEVVTQTDLSRKTQPFIKKEQLHAVLDIMNELAMIQRFEYKPKRAGGRPTTVYRGTKHLLRKGSVDEVLERTG